MMYQIEVHTTSESEETRIVRFNPKAVQAALEDSFEESEIKVNVLFDGAGAELEVIIRVLLRSSAISLVITASILINFLLRPSTRHTARPTWQSDMIKLENIIKTLTLISKLMPSFYLLLNLIKYLGSLSPLGDHVHKSQQQYQARLRTEHQL